MQDSAALEERPSKHLWLGNLNARLLRTTLKAYFETFGPVDDVVTFPGRMYAFVNFRNPEDARVARARLDDQQARHEPGIFNLQLARYSRNAERAPGLHIWQLSDAGFRGLTHKVHTMASMRC